jgi:hypothetical protein
MLGNTNEGESNFAFACQLFLQAKDIPYSSISKDTVCAMVKF